MDHLTKLEEMLDQANLEIKNGKYENASNIPGVTKAAIYNEYAIMHEQQGQLDEAIEKYKMAGMNTLDKAVLDRAKTSIERCKSKKDFI
jgi:tetratricopeptide (TPR) repeat protein